MDAPAGVSSGTSEEAVMHDEDQKFDRKNDASGEQILHALRERAKELNCLYAVDEILSRHGQPIADVLRSVAEALPAGWQYTDICRARVVLVNGAYSSWNINRDRVVASPSVQR